MILAESVSVAIVSRDRPHLLARLLSSLLFQRHSNFEVLVCLNTDTSWNEECDQAMLALFHRNVKCRILPAVGYSFSDMHHLALMSSSCNLVLRLDDDHIPSPDLLSSLLQAIGSESTIAAAAPIVLHPQQKTIAFALAEFEEALKRAREQGILNTDLQLFCHPTSSPLVVPDLYSTFLMKKSVAFSVGGIARCYQACGYREETDLTLRLTLAGFTTVIVPAAVVWHFRASLGGERRTPQQWSACRNENEKIFRKRLQSWQVRIPETFDPIWSMNHMHAAVAARS